MPNMKYQLWQEPDDCQTFCLAGVEGNSARALIDAQAVLVWEVEAESHFDAMTKYYAYMQWGEYLTDLPDQDKAPQQKSD